MANKSFYITTPIYYPSAKLHIGHAYCTTIADAMARFKRLAGYDVFFLTGSDEHGQKIQQAAEKEGVTPIEYVDKIVAGFQALWQRLHISNDDFLRTSEPRHHRVVQEFFRRAKAKGDVYKGEYTGLYCTPCESYWTELQLDEDGCCPDCHRPVQQVSEEAYFFKLSNYADKLLKHIKENPDFIRPTSRRNEMISFIERGLDDLCISRTSFDWGIPVPDDEKHVIYVWFDALTNYVTAAGFFDDPEKFKKFWPADVHLVGKEIVRFHSIIWPAILMSLDLPLPKQIYGHGWLIVDGDKMSKSKGNVVDPNDVVDVYGADVLRVYVLFMGDYGSAAPWNDSSVKGCKRFLDRVASLPEMVSGKENPKLETAFHKTVKKVSEDIDEMKFNTAIAALMTLLNDIADQGSLTKDQLVDFIKLLNPFAPHLTEEIWENIGGKGFLSLAPWPEWDEAKTVDDEIEIAVQIGGKLKGTILVPKDISKDDAIAAAKADPKIAPLLAGKSIVKEIYVPGRIVNIVAK